MAELKKTLGAGTLIALGAAGVIGSSFLYLSSAFFSEFGAGGVILGMIGATFLAACVALAISELTSAFPRAGGEFVYAFAAFNRPVGFLVGWIAIGIYVGIVAFYVTAAGFLLAQVVPNMESIPLYAIGGETVYLPVLALGVVLMLIMLGLNWFGAQLALSAQLVLFLVMVGLGAIIVVVGFGHGEPSNFFPAFAPESQNVTGALISSTKFILPALGFLTGFSIVAVMAEEAKISPKKVGSIVIFAVIVAGAFYAIIFAATAWVIPWTKTAGLQAGTIDAFREAGFAPLAMAAFVIGVLGIVTTFLAVFSAVSRLLFSLSRAGMLPRFLSAVDPKYGVPRNALLFTAAAGLAMGWIGPGGLTWFLNTGGVNLAFMWIFTVAAFYQLRRTHPHLGRPYRVRQTWLPALGGAAGVILVVVSLVPGTPLSLGSVGEYVIVLAWPLFGFLLYWLTKKPADPEDSLRLLLGDYYHEFRNSEPDQLRDTESAEAQPRQP